MKNEGQSKIALPRLKRNVRCDWLNCSLVRAEVFDVDVAAQTGVEQQIPAGMMVIVINIDLVAVPLPVTAAVEIVGSHHPIGIVVQKDVASAVIKAARDIHLSHVLITAVRISATGPDAVVVGIPALVMRVVG